MPELPSNSRFLILGNSVSGTSLVQGVLDAHPDVVCHFEHFPHRRKPDMALDTWLTESCINGTLWGNKIPFEQFLTNEWPQEKIVALVDCFKVIFIQRRFSMYAKQNKNRENYKHWWQTANFYVYWEMRERRPDNIIAVSFEDLCLRPTTELYRICDFLGIDFLWDEMYKGTINKKSRQKTYGFDISRV